MQPNAIAFDKFADRRITPIDRGCKDDCAHNPQYKKNNDCKQNNLPSLHDTFAGEFVLGGRGLRPARQHVTASIVPRVRFLFFDSIRPVIVSAMPRKPSYLSSNSHAGSSNGSRRGMGMIRSMDRRQSGRMGRESTAKMTPLSARNVGFYAARVCVRARRLVFRGQP